MSEADDSVKERRRSRKSLLTNNQKLMEKFDNLRTPVGIIRKEESSFEKEVELLKERVKSNEESLARIESLLKEKEKGEKRVVDETCCIGYCTIM